MTGLTPSALTEIADLKRRLADLEMQVRQIPPRQSGWVEKGTRAVIPYITPTGTLVVMDARTHDDIGSYDQASDQQWQHGATFLAYESSTGVWFLTKRLTQGPWSRHNAWATAVGTGMLVKIAYAYGSTSYLSGVYNDGTGIGGPWETTTSANAALLPLHWPGRYNAASEPDEYNLQAGLDIGFVQWSDDLQAWVPFCAIRACSDVAYLDDTYAIVAPELGNVLQWSTTLSKWRPGWGWPTGGTDGQVLTKTGSGWADVAWETPSDGGGGGVPAGGTTGQVLAKTSDTDYATGWVTPSSGGGDITIEMTPGHGVCFSDNTTSKTGTSFTLDWLPWDTSVDALAIKGSMLYRAATASVGTSYSAEILNFPAAAARNSVLVADATTELPKWVKAIEVGDTTNAGGSLKIWYAAGKYFELNSAGKLTCYESATNNVVIDLAGGNGIKYIFASGKYVQVSNAGKIIAYESSTIKCEVDAATGSIINTRAGVAFSVCDIATITSSMSAPSEAGRKGQLYCVY